MAHPIITLARFVVWRSGWTFVGTFQDPPEPPPGFILETQRDSFLGFVTHYRFVPEVKANG